VPTFDQPRRRRPRALAGIAMGRSSVRWLAIVSVEQQGPAEDGCCAGGGPVADPEAQ
jgi:hypothetical protein